MSGGHSENIPECGICRLTARIRAGQFPDFIAELEQTWVILGDAQFYRGYCVLLLKEHFTELHELSRARAHVLFDEIQTAARAISRIVRPARLNYECLGNQEPHLHWHIFPRTAEDPMRTEPVWMRPEMERKVRLEDRDRLMLIDSLRSELAASRQL
ncbi:MAG: HIT family protein [Candidatus Binataceae bacterium]